MMEGRVERAEDVIWREIGDEIAVIRVDGMAVYVLNKTAVKIWKMCDGSFKPDEIAAKLCESYNVSLEQANTDVRNALARMMEKGLVKCTDEVTGK